MDFPARTLCSIFPRCTKSSRKEFCRQLYQKRRKEMRIRQTRNLMYLVVSEPLWKRDTLNINPRRADLIICYFNELFIGDDILNKYVSLNQYV